MLFILAGCSSEEANPVRSSDGPPVAGHEVTRQDLSRLLRLAGTIQPRERIEIRNRIVGIIENFYVEEGDVVEAGDLLVTVDLAEINAELTKAQAELAWVQRRYNRKAPLVQSGAVIPAEFEALEAELEVAKSNVALWETRMSQGQIIAPRPAIVVSRRSNPGSTVSAQELLLILADVSSLVIQVKVSDTDVVKIDRDQKIKVEIDAYPNQPIWGKIRRIFADADYQSRRITVELELEEVAEDMNILPGFLARVNLEVDRRNDVIAIPTEALLASEGDDVFVYLIEDNKLVRRNVERGRVRRNRTEISKGLTAGDIIVGTNPSNLREGMSVRITQWVE